MLLFTITYLSTTVERVNERWMEMYLTLDEILSSLYNLFAGVTNLKALLRNVGECSLGPSLDIEGRRVSLERDQLSSCVYRSSPLLVPRVWKPSSDRNHSCMTT